MHMSADTAAALPPLDPPGIRPKSQGLAVFLNPEFSVEEPMANSSMLVLPTKTLPASRSFFATVASYGGTKLARILEAQVVNVPRVQTLSFKARGMPMSGDCGSPEASALSAASAAARASSPMTVI
jgi:hypothetical protein